VDQPAEQVDPFDLGARIDRRVGTQRYGEAKAAMRSTGVVMFDVDVQHMLEVAAVEDECPVQTLLPYRADPAFGVGVRDARPDWCDDHFSAFGGEYGVEPAAELGVPVPDEEPEPAAVVGELGEQIPRLLGDPDAGRVRSDPRQPHPSAVQLDEEQDVQAGQRDRLDSEEVAGKNASGLAAQELGPAWAAGPRRRAEPVAAQDGTD
jgi:hypothetical protein